MNRRRWTRRRWHRRDGRPWFKYPPNVHLLLIERRAVREPIVIELAPEARRPAPTGFWRRATFYSIVKILGQRFEKGETFLRVLADRGCFDLHRVADVDPWTWRARSRWELTAELAALPVRPHSS